MLHEGQNMEQNRKRVIWPVLLALFGLALCCLYGLHVYYVANSSLIYMPYAFENTDMHANLAWAKSIHEQGWLNPKPHHPYTPWMEKTATYNEWVSWWGGEAIFQQS